MPSETPAGFEPRKRLHRLSWLFVSVDYLKHFLVPMLAAIFFGAQQDLGPWTLLLVLPLVAAALWHQWIYRYDFGPQGLVIREGLLFRNVRNIDYRRIENIDTERNLLHRLFDVAQVSVETSSGGGSEAVIRVLDLEAVREMRNRIFAVRTSAAESPGETEVAEENTLLRLSPGELLRFGLIDNRGLIVVAAVFGLVAELGTEKLMETWATPWLEILPVEDFAAFGPMIQSFLVLSSIIGLIAGTRLLSVLLAFITLHDFRLSQSRDDLRVRYGLLTRISLTLRRQRIQALHRKATLLHRWLGRESLTVDLAGGLRGGDARQEDGSRSVRKPWLAPVCTPEKGEELVHVALPQVRLDEADWQRLAPGARARLFRISSFLWLLFSIPAIIMLAGPLASFCTLLVLPFLWMHAHLYVKYTRWALHDDFLAVRRGWFTQRLSVTPRNRIQSVCVSESPFDRRHGMAGLAVDTAGASGLNLRIPYLERDTALELASALRSQ
ncbi:MAG: PH domain-containing protein [Proteobacteria bacterium]|nr:PH domain-containing protein [Pseudomonadota bacterium]